MTSESRILLHLNERNGTLACEFGLKKVQFLLMMLQLIGKLTFNLGQFALKEEEMGLKICRVIGFA